MEEIIWVKIKFDKFKHSTQKAVLINIQNEDVWLPRYATKNLKVNKKLGGNVEVKKRFLDEKEIHYDLSQATVIYKHHTPVKLDSRQIVHDKNLER